MSEQGVCPTEEEIEAEEEIGRLQQVNAKLLAALEGLCPLGSNGPLDLAWSECRRTGEHRLAEELTRLGNLAREVIKEAREERYTEPLKVVESEFTRWNNQPWSCALCKDDITLGEPFGYWHGRSAHAACINAAKAKEEA